MKPLQDCEFTAFISYAHADDAAWFNWVTQFRTELERGLQALLRGVRLPRLHLSGENGPVAGALSDELRRRVEASFAMIIVVHDNYAQSDWCLQELAYFKSLFGERGFQERLYIVALSEAAMLQVSASAAWRALIPGDDQIWMPFYDPADKARPLDIYMSPGFVSPAFRQPFERLRGNLAAKLRQSAALPPGAATARRPDPAPRATATRADTAVAPTPGREVLIGFVPPASTAAAARAAQLLAQRGLPARVLSQDVVFTDFAEFAAAERLLLIVDDTPPMLTSVAAGGHLEVQRDAWLKRGGAPERLHWLDLRADTVPDTVPDATPDATPDTARAATPAASPAAPTQAAAAWVVAQGGTLLRPPALADLLCPPAPAAAPPAVAGVRIYIESNRNERTLWEPLGEQIRRKWDLVCQRLAPGGVPALSLRARGLPVDQIDSFPNLDDADGVVLLWGRKTSEALVAQINKVENKMTAGRDAAPGIVAYLMPPQQATEPVPAWGWQVLRFNAPTEDDIDVVSEETGQLERFLKKVYERRQQRDRPGGGR